MRGYPKHLNTKADYEYVRTHFNKSYWETDFKNLLFTQTKWITTGVLAEGEEGIEDETHRVLEESLEGTGSDLTRVQQELVYDENCKMDKLGYTEEEVKAILEID